MQSLYFEGMERYHTRPIVSHPGTFEWLFNQDSLGNACGPHVTNLRQAVPPCHRPWLEHKRCEEPLRLKTWLESGNDIFWVQGKAGSGKSTFMKFLFEHSQTREHLRKWADGDVCMAAFFFWKSGTELEKSHIGLLRGLLYQLLRALPEILTRVLPERCEAAAKSSVFQRPWTLKELEKCFETVAQTSDQLRFFFMIDGLDEFEGDHRDLIDALEKLNHSPNIKICVSSRPWNVFRTAFGSDRNLNIALHELTARDIHFYVATRLRRSRGGLGNLRQSELEALGDLLCRKAKGVFLWVNIAVSDLRKGIDEHDDIYMLRKRLEGYPSELDGMFQHTLDRVNPVYKKFAGRLMLMMLNSECSPGLIGLPYLATEEDIMLEPRLFPTNATEIKGLIDRAVIDMNKWCRDLLSPVNLDEVYENISDFLQGDTFHIIELMEATYFHLNFGHKSIFDFVCAKESDGTLSEMAGHGFDPYTSYVDLLVRISRHAPNLIKFQSCADSAITCAAKFHQDGSFPKNLKTFSSLPESVFQSLLGLDLIGSDLARNQGYSHWTVGHLSGTGAKHLKRVRASVDKQNSTFMSYSVSMNVDDFLLRSLEGGGFTLTAGQKQFALECMLLPDIYQCMGGISDRWYDETGLNHLDIVLQIVRSGIDVNRPTPRHGCSSAYSVWQFFLLWLHDLVNAISASWYKDTGICDIFQAFLQSGADPFAAVSSLDLFECFKGVSPPEKATLFTVAELLGDMRTERLQKYWTGKEVEVRNEFVDLLSEHLMHASRQRHQRKLF